MKPNPHDLINLPGAGNAEKALRKAGMWCVTMTDEERIEWLAENAVSVKRLNNSQSWSLITERANYDPDFFRDDIDEASSAMEAH